MNCNPGKNIEMVTSYLNGNIVLLQKCADFRNGLCIGVRNGLPPKLTPHLDSMLMTMVMCHQEIVVMAVVETVVVGEDNEAMDGDMVLPMVYY